MRNLLMKDYMNDIDEVEERVPQDIHDLLKQYPYNV